MFETEITIKVTIQHLFSGRALDVFNFVTSKLINCPNLKNFQILSIATKTYDGISSQKDSASS